MRPNLTGSGSKGTGGIKGEEDAIRQLMAGGKAKSAPDRAKEHRKALASAESEALLIDAYLARIHSLADQNLQLEAKSLQQLLRERFPAAGAKLELFKAANAARGSDLETLLSPLNDPALAPERRAFCIRLFRW
jgi:hypothetical protein